MFPTALPLQIYSILKRNTESMDRERERAIRERDTDREGM